MTRTERNRETGSQQRAARLELRALKRAAQIRKAAGRVPETYVSKSVRQPLQERPLDYLEQARRLERFARREERSKEGQAAGLEAAAEQAALVAASNSANAKMKSRARRMTLSLYSEAFSLFMESATPGRARYDLSRMRDMATKPHEKEAVRILDQLFSDAAHEIRFPTAADIEPVIRALRR